MYNWANFLTLKNMVTETRKIGYFEKVGGAIKGVLIGLLLLVISIFVLFKNEGKVDLSKYAVDAMPVLNSEDLANLDGQFVAITGEVSVENTLEDGIASMDNILKLNRDVETYAWVEESKTTTKKNVGGSETQTTEYTYSQDWVTSVPDSSKFKDPVGHTNIDTGIEGVNVSSDSFNLLGLTLSTDGMKMPGASEDVTAEVEVLDYMYSYDNGYLFDGIGTVASPEVGDVRVKYTALKGLDNATVFGKWNATQERLDPHYPLENEKIYSMYKGGKEEAVQTMHGEYVAMKWGIRIGMLLLMFVAFNLIFAPLHTVLDVIPFFGNLGSSAASIVSFILTLLVGLLVILLGKVWYSWILFVILGLGLAGIGYKYYNKKKA